MATVQSLFIYEKEPDHPGRPEPGLPPLVSDWDEPESGAAALQYPCEQTENSFLDSTNNYAWLGLLVSVADLVAADYVFEPCGGDDRPRLKCNLNLIQEIDSFPWADTS